MFARLTSRAQPAVARIRQLSSQVGGAAGNGGGFNKAAVGAAAVGAAAIAYYAMSSTTPATPAAAVAVPKKEYPPALDPSEFRSFTVADVHRINHNTAIFRLALPHADQTLNLPTTSFVLTKTGDIVRPYTPTSPDDAQGHFDLLVKQYPGGKMSSHIHSLKVGDSLEVKGPIPKYPLAANQHTQIAMVAGGTGITPMLQIVNKLLADPADKTKLTLVFANVSEHDILLKDQLDALTQKHGNRFKVQYVLDKPQDAKAFTAQGGVVGFVTKDLLAKKLPFSAKDENVKVFVCGPPGFVAAISGSKAPDYSQGELAGALKDLGFDKDQVFKF
ncbi:NADH-cytochrome b5 reductase [Allomyces javanicus]|nr:NADH-cytochrome b5 reductase [Allomyces javanicus]